MQFPLRHALALGLIVLLLGLYVRDHFGGTSGEEYPARTIKLVVPFNPGGGSDSFGRMIQQGIEQAELLPQPLVVINRPGASATIGSRYVKDAKPDGYTLLLLHNAMITAQASGTVNYGPESFEPIAGTGEVGMVIAVHESSRFKTLKQLLDEAKTKPDSVVHGVNLGAPTHFAALKLEQASSAQFRFTQAGDGADRFSKLKEHIDVAGFSVSEFLSFRSEGLRGLAVLDVKRNSAMENVPTAIEQGYDVTELNSHYWWFPKGTPQDRVDYIADVLEKVMQTDYVLEKMAELNAEPRFFRGTEFQRLLNKRVTDAKSVGQQESPKVPNIPLFVAGGLIACLAFTVFVRSKQTKSAPEAALDAVQKNLDFRRAGLLLFAVVMYVGVMQVHVIPFPVATSVFIVAAGVVLSREPRQVLLPLTEVALIVSFGTHYVLTNVVITDLP